ncbi:hypothetical protein DH2020_015810 [Rehmannia glutinosa]|uniref:Pectinesterase inhibitor domain-containing protein n=1 Tax=Rehmannia glutinosa TaxID=99300 RepID=A0ABR0WTR2_REHGL
MKLPFASFLILNISLLFLLANTTNAKLISTNIKSTDKVFSNICPKTKQPNICLIVLKDDSRTRGAANNHELGYGTLDIAISQAKSCVDIFFYCALKMNDGDRKEKYLDCRDKYNFAVGQLCEAKTILRKNDFATARRRIVDASQVPISCQKEIGEPPVEVRSANIVLDFIFDIAYVIVRELAINRNS